MTNTTTESPDLSLGPVEYLTGDFADEMEKWVSLFRFEPSALETGKRVVLKSNSAHLVVTSASIDPRAAAWLETHGDGVRDIALATPSPRHAFNFAVANGAQPVDAARCIVRAFGNVTHTFVERPVGAADRHRGMDQAKAFGSIDHFAVCLQPGTITEQVALYERAFGLKEIFSERTVVGEQAMISHVVSSPDRSVCLTLIEPDISQSAGQVDQFLDRNSGPGVQHIALETGNIIESVRRLSERGVAFLSTPSEYYRELEKRYQPEKHSMEELEVTDVLLDEDEGGQLFQIFAESVHARGTFFLELIERRGARTFGTRNITALYEAVERANHQ